MVLEAPDSCILVFPSGILGRVSNVPSFFELAHALGGRLTFAYWMCLIALPQMSVRVVSIHEKRAALYLDASASTSKAS